MWILEKSVKKVPAYIYFTHNTITYKYIILLYI